MIAVDTSILARFILRDDEREFQLACTALWSSDIYVPITVTLELDWVLWYRYNRTAAERIDTWNALLDVPNFHFAEAAAIRQALTGLAQGLDFADSLHAALSAGCDQFVTFDKAFAVKARDSFGTLVHNLGADS